MARVKKILAPTDFSDLSKRGVRYALEMARDTSAEVIVYYAIDVTSEWHDKPAITQHYHDTLEDTQKQLDKFLADHFADCIDLIEVRKVVEFGAPAGNILEMAQREGVDMIVMSTHGRTGLSHMMLGSITEKVVARASCPVLVVPRGEHGTAARAA
jgi:nucleotide-binding universal stress UspA family protein